MTETEQDDGLRGKLTIRARQNMIRAVTRFVHEVALSEGLTHQEAGQLEVITEEACLNVMQHAFDGRENAFLDVFLERRPGQFVIAVEDKGLPFDWKKVHQGEKAGFGISLMKAFTDEIRYINLGKGGKRLEMIKDLSYGALPDTTDEESRQVLSEREALPADLPITFRQMEPDEGVALARCIFRGYGYTYGSFAYFPEKVRELLLGGLQESLVAVTPDGEIVAHQALVRERPDSRIAEMGQGVVDPRCRGRGLFEKIKALSVEHARKRGLYGLFTETVTIHPYSQKANLSVGARETGILLGYVPQLVSFKKLAGRQKQRQAAVIFYHRTNAEPERVIYPPLQHRHMIQRIYEHAKLARRMADGACPALPESGESALVDVKVNAEWGFAFMRISGFGHDLQDIVRVRLQELCLARIDCIYIDLPLSHPSAPFSCSALEILGFSFVGLIPEMQDGDILRLQYLNNVPIDPSLVVMVSDFGRELLKYVLEARQVKAVS